MLNEVKNNNPGNIRYSVYNNWVGQLGQDYRGFVVFDTLQHGIRAMVILILNYIDDGDNCIAEIISRYAPTNENDTEAYIDTVSNMTGIGMYDDISGNDSDIINTIYCMIKVESGVFVPMVLVTDAYNNEFDPSSTPGSPSLLIPAIAALALYTYSNN